MVSTGRVSSSESSLMLPTMPTTSRTTSGENVSVKCFPMGSSLGQKRRASASLISEALARRFWPNEDPIGKHLTLTFSPDVVREVVGIVGNIKLDSLDETRPVDTIYVALAQVTVSPGETWRSFGLTLAVRTHSDPHGAASAVTDAIHQVAPDVPVVDVLSMDDVIAQSMSSQRFNLLLLASFTGLALVLAAVGIYGVLSYTLRRWVLEIGIRMV